MRVVVAFLAFAAVACSAFAWSEFRALRTHGVVDLTPPPEDAAAAGVSVEKRRSVEQQPQTSTWRGQLPFGGVPSSGEADVVGATDDVDSDGPVAPAHVIIDGEGRRITLERSEIIIY